LDLNALTSAAFSTLSSSTFNCYYHSYARSFDLPKGMIIRHVINAFSYGLGNETRYMISAALVFAFLVRSSGRTQLRTILLLVHCSHGPPVPEAKPLFSSSRQAHTKRRFDNYGQYIYNDKHSLATQPSRHPQSPQVRPPPLNSSATASNLVVTCQSLTNTTDDSLLTARKRNKPSEYPSRVDAVGSIRVL